jgi:3-dehydroquinate dehydratase-2
MKILVINGPNMNMLGIREKENYGTSTLSDINHEIERTAEKLKADVQFFQSNCEGGIIDKIHEANDSYDGIVINPAALTHYSVAVLDAINSISVPVVEVHMTNIFAREEFRRKTITGAGCIGVISGFGKNSYNIAVNALLDYLRDKR